MEKKFSNEERHALLLCFTIIIKNLTEDFSKKKKKKCELLAYVLKPLHCKGKWVSPFPTLD